MLNRTVVPDSIPVQNPFKDTFEHQRNLTLYIPVSSATSGGRAAAWHSKNWHLLNQIQELRDRDLGVGAVIWLDLTSSLPEGSRKCAFGLESAGSKRSRLVVRLRKILEEVDFHDMGDMVRAYLAGRPDADIARELTSVSQSWQPSSRFIVVIDGWNELRQLVHGSERQRLTALEQILVEKLIKNENEVIWVDSGIQHTKMNLTYQRPCVHPLEADSPRRLCLGEILWNLPLPPRGFGWQAPWFDDKRVIVQDTATSASPWSTVIDVPMLRHWHEKFRGLSNKDGTIQEFEVRSAFLTDDDMYGRSVRLASIQADMQHLSMGLITDIREKAMTLAPSLLRPRSKEEHLVALNNEQASLTMVSLTAAGASSPTLSDRLHLQPCHPPPEPGRSKMRYVDQERITRHWQNKSSRKDYKGGDEARVTRRPPIYTLTISRMIDSDRTRRLELKRLMHTANYLRQRLDPGEDSEALFEDIVACCRSALGGPRNGHLYLEALVKIRDMILENTRRKGAWALIEQERNSLGDILSHENRAALQRALFS